MNIIFPITSLIMGGAENQVVNLADKLAERGHNVTLAYLLNPVVVKPSNPNVNVVWLGGSKSVFGMAKAYLNLVKLVKSLNPDVIHSHMFHANILARMTRLVTKNSRLVCTAHNTNEGGKLRMLAYRLTDSFADEFTNVSQEAVEAFEYKKAAPVGRMMATHNGINTNRFSFNQQARERLRHELSIEGHKVFIGIGRFHEQKDFPNLLDAFSLLLLEHPNSRLLVVGGGDLRPQIEKKIQELDIQNQVALLGIRNDVPELLSAADVFVLSSAWEGFGLVVAEAMAVERLVVATDCGGVAEVLGDKGFLVKPKDSAALATAMISAANMDKNEANELGKFARQRIVEKYSLDAVVDRWEEIYFDS